MEELYGAEAVADRVEASVMVVQGGWLEIEEAVVVMEELYGAEAVVSKCFGSVSVNWHLPYGMARRGIRGAFPLSSQTHTNSPSNGSTKKDESYDDYPHPEPDK